MDDFNSETDSDYTSYWRDWVSTFSSWLSFCALPSQCKKALATAGLPFMCSLVSLLLRWDVCEFGI